MMLYLRLFYEFFKTGLFAIGGGLATLPFLQDMAEKTGWFTSAQLADMIAISESTPGPIGVNMATYVGYTTGGIWGGVVATIGLILPSILIILLISLFLRAFRDSPYVKAVFYGLRPASTGLIAAAGFSVVTLALLRIDTYRTSGLLTDLFQWKALILAAVLLVATRKMKAHPIVFIAVSAVIGAVFRFAGA